MDDATFARVAKAYGISVAELSTHPNDQPRAQQLDLLLRNIQNLDADQLSRLNEFLTSVGRPK